MTFPTQTLGKCGKMIPVLVLGALVRGKAYAWREYAVAALVTVGCLAFLTTGVLSFALALYYLDFDLNVLNFLFMFLYLLL